MLSGITNDSNHSSTRSLDRKESVPQLNKPNLGFSKLWNEGQVDVTNTVGLGALFSESSFPGISSFIQDIPEYEKLPIIGMCVSSDRFLKESAIDAGMTLLLVKPFTAKELFATMLTVDSMMKLSGEISV